MSKRRLEDLIGDDDDDIARITRRVSAKSLSIHDVAQVCGSIIRKERKEILEHVNRLFRLAEIKSHKSVDGETRPKNLNARLLMLESAVRQLSKKVGP
jgi:hypothetical protein